MIKKLTILGLGLIGGSLARGIAQNQFADHIQGWGRRDASLITAKELGAIDSFTLDLDEALDGADVVVIATPTLIAGDMLKQVIARAATETIITDVASVKGNLLEDAKRANNGQEPSNLVLAHPIAGSEQSGISAARADLFVNHRVILTPTQQTDKDAVKVIQAMWESVGAQVLEMSVLEHDRILASTSHLPHVLAYALVDALSSDESSEDIFNFAAGGFRDFTRIASSDPTMWQEISLANRQAILESIDAFSEHLSALRTAIKNEDGDKILATFERAKVARDAFVHKSNSN